MHSLQFKQWKFIAFFSLMTFCMNACKDSLNNPTERVRGLTENIIPSNVTYLVADTDGYGTARIDTNLKNAWGIGIAGTNTFWVSSNHTGLSAAYDGSGNQMLPYITIPSRTSASGGSPTG